MKILPRFLLWFAVIANIVLPAVSSAGYMFYHIEFLIIISTCLLLAALLFPVSRIPYLSGLLLTLIVAFSTQVYFAKFFIRQGYAPAIIAGLLLAGFLILSLRRFDKALLLAGIVALSQTAAALITTPTYIDWQTETPVARPDIPSVVHILLDEHAGIATFPKTAIPEAEVERFRDDYVDQGFMVFTHAYTADHHTEKSIFRLLHKGDMTGAKILTEKNAAYDMPYSTTFEEIGKDRAIDITHLRWLNLSHSVKSIPSVARTLGYNATTATQSSRYFGLPLDQRMNLAVNHALNWVLNGINSPLMRWFFYENKTGHDFLLTTESRHSYPLVSLMVLQQLTQRLATSGQRGTYYFAHLLIPHYPYIFDGNCNVIPTFQWRREYLISRNSRKMMADRDIVYRLNFAQSNCAKNEIMNLMHALASRKEMSDAVVLIHSDHGSRIAARPVKNYYTAKDYKRDMRGSFIALRIPGIPGRVIDTPVRLDTLYMNLMENQFRTIDLEKLKPLKDSPY